ncbi:hypothetical protein LNP74_07635 [Klebsiella pneumoniae subsp. pneumoniae]|nr:hypothetical protein [Klebsiella pneumoniae subsp. pneumoniae]
MIGAILFVAGSLFSAAAPNVEILLVSRVLLGLGGGRRLPHTGLRLYLSESPQKNSRQYDFHVPADDHHRDPWRLSL